MAIEIEGMVLNLNQRRWRVLLFASLALNLFVLGALSVFWLGRGPFVRRFQGMDGVPHGAMGRGGPGGAELLRDVVRVMGGPHDPRVHELWQSRRADQAQFRRRLQAARVAAQTAMATEPFDRQKLESALSELQQVTNEAQQRAQAGAVELAQKLSPAERAQLRP